MKREVGLFLGVVTMCSACLGQTPGLPFTVSKETTAIVEPLKGDGTVDYVAAVNQLYGKGVTAENNGYVVWLGVMGTDSLPQAVRGRTLTLLGVDAKDFASKGFDMAGAPDDMPNTLWKSEGHPKTAKFLEDNGKFLDLAVTASGKPMWWDTAVSRNGSMEDVLLPSLNSLRVVARALCCRAMLRMGAGDFDGFARDVVAAKRLGRNAAGWTLISLLVCATIDRQADEALGAVVGRGSLMAGQCGVLAKALDGIAPMPQVVDVIDVSERWDRLEGAELLAMGKLSQTALHGTPLAPLARVKADIDWDVVLKRMNQRSDELVAIMRDPKLAQMQEMDRALRKNLDDLRIQVGNARSFTKGANETREAFSNRVADLWTVTVSPNFGKVVETMHEARMRDEMVRALVAVAQFRAENSRWPGALGELVPKYLAAVPKDIYSAGAAENVRYVQGDAGIYVYSVGPNGVDDGGQNDDIGMGVAVKAGEQGL